MAADLCQEIRQKLAHFITDFTEVVFFHLAQGLNGQVLETGEPLDSFGLSSSAKIFYLVPKRDCVFYNVKIKEQKRLKIDKHHSCSRSHIITKEQVTPFFLKVGTHEGTSPCDQSLQQVPGTKSSRVNYRFSSKI